MIPGLVSRSYEIPNEMLTTMIQSSCCNFPIWIRQRSKIVETLVPQIDKCSNLIEISFGYLTSIAAYCWSKNIQNDSLLEWKTDIREKYLAIKYKSKFTVELRLNQDCLDKYFLMSTENIRTYTMILPLKAIPRCYCIIQAKKRSYTQRTLDFGIIDGSCLVNSSAICLKFHEYNSLISCAEFLINVLKLDCHQGYFNCTQMLTPKLQFDHILSDFWSSYAFQMLLTLGDRIKHQITIVTLRKIIQLSYSSRGQQYPNHKCYLKLMAVYFRARFNRFFDINQEFDNIQAIPSNIILDKWEYVPRIYLTPYGTYPLPVKPMRGNRILRERNLFGSGKHFCRVIIRDIDLGQPQIDFIQINEKWINDLILGKTNIIVGDQTFEFLLCSNSQLRDRSFWFYAPYNGRRAKHIRQWMGDFSSEKCIGRRIARMALSLTGTTATIKLLPHQIQKIDDKLDDHDRIFTDGI
ncbi:unnamed protein product, partial [Rotaria sordida]